MLSGVVEKNKYKTNLGCFARHFDQVEVFPDESEGLPFEWNRGMGVFGLLLGPKDSKLGAFARLGSDLDGAAYMQYDFANHGQADPCATPLVAGLQLLKHFKNPLVELWFNAGSIVGDDQEVEIPGIFMGHPDQSPFLVVVFPGIGDQVEENLLEMHPGALYRGDGGREFHLEARG
jgi:hypothetical protein